MKKKHLSFLLTCACCMLLCVSLTSCPGDDEPDMPTDVDVPNQGSGTGSDDKDAEKEAAAAREQLKQLAKNYVTITPDYRDYFWIMDIKSTLHTKLPGKTVRFAFGCGELDDDDEKMMTEANLSHNCNCSINKRISGDAEIITIKVPFWYYYMFGWGRYSDFDYAIFTKCEMFYASYMALLDRGQQSWSQDEWALYNDLVKYLNEYELPTKWDFKPSIWVYTEDCAVMINRYKRL